MAVFLEKYQDEIPCIGKVRAHIPEPPVTDELEWWYGRYSTVCKKREGRDVVVWTESVPADSILTEVKLTKSN